jgi:hypothetical protein
VKSEMDIDHIQWIFNKFEENRKSGRGGGIVGCHVTSRQCKPINLAVNVRVATKR